MSHLGTLDQRDSSRPEPASDAVLLGRVARGDETAFAQFYDRHAPVVYGLALRIVRDGHHAEDIVQEAFLSLWRTASTFDPAKARASTWLGVLVHRRAVELVRREECRRTAPLPRCEEACDDHGADESVITREERRTAQEALTRVSAEQRRVLELAYYGGLTQPEIARRLGIPLGTVKSRTFKGLARLAALLSVSESSTESAPATRLRRRSRACAQRAPSAPRTPG